MKSSLLVGTLAVTLASSLNAEVFVLGASWRERLRAAPEGQIERGKRDAAAPRGYVILETTEEGLEGAFIEYRNVRGLGKSYSVTTGFTGFKADIVDDTYGTSRRMYGHILTPVTGTTVEDPMMSFSGSVSGESSWPNRLAFDKAVFQTGLSTDLAGPVIVDGSTMSRSELSGGGTRFRIASTTMEDAITELSTRLEEGGYSRNAVAPVIVTDLPATVVRAGWVTDATLSVGLGPDVFPTPTYTWFKGTTEVGTGATYTLPGGAEGDGTYHVEVSTSAGSATSGETVVTTTNKAMEITPAGATAVQVSFTGTLELAPTVNADAYPQVVSYQWAKAPAATPTVFTNIAAGNGGTQPTFTVSGNSANTNGPGVYRLTVSNGTTTLNSGAYTVTTAP